MKSKSLPSAVRQIRTWLHRFVRRWLTLPRSLKSLKAEIEKEHWPRQMVYNLKCPRCGADELDDGENYPGGLSYSKGSAYGEGGSGWYAVKCHQCSHHYAQNADW